MDHNYITKLNIHNFQSHRNTSLDFAPPGQLTVIVGPSDNGKTAIIRALKLLAYNSPQGVDYIRVGENEAQVQGIMADGSKVARQRTRGGVNRYILEPTGQQRQIFEGFGVSVPLEVRQLIGMSPISIGDIDFNLNLSEQLDGPFLGNGVPVTAKAKVLGKLSGVEEVDHANKALGTDLYRMRREKEGVEAKIKSLEEQIKAYDYLDKLGALISIIEEAYNKLAANMARKETLLKLQIQFIALHTTIQEERHKICKLQFVDTMQVMLTKAEADCGKYDRLVRLVGELKQVQDELDRVQTIIDKAQNIAVAMEMLDKASENAKKIERLQGLSEQLEAVQIVIIRAEAKIEDLKQIDRVREMLAALEQRETRRAAIKMKFDQLTEVQNKIATVTGGLTAAKTAIENTKKQMLDVFSEAGMCPTCGTAASELDFEKIKEGF